MSVLKFSLVIIVFLVFASQAFVFSTFAEVSEYEAASALADADRAVGSAYQTALKAEEAGASVSGLFVRLNEAGEFLAKARMAYKLGNFTEATRLANLSVNIGEEVQNVAVELKDSALSQSLQRMLFTMITSITGIALIGLGSLWVWHFLKKRYVQYRNWFIVGSLALMLVAASSTSALFIQLPSDSEKFSKLWLLGPGHKVEDYPSNVRVNETYSAFVGVGNHLGYPAYYRVYVKFRNQTQPLPDLSNSVSSPLNSTYEFLFFVADGKTWEAPLIFSFQGEPMRINRILINDFVIPINCSSIRDQEHNGFYYQFFLELWLYNTASQSLQFHNRFVGIWLNMTS